MKLAINWHSRLFKLVYHKIESTSNPRIKHLVRLRKSSRYRRETALFIVEGKREIEAFNAAGRNLEEIYFSQSMANEISSSSILSTLLERVPSFELSEDAINKVSYRQHGSKFIGVAKTWNLKLRSPIDLNWKLVLVLDEVEKPGNLGAILRTAEALGVDAILLSDSCVDFFNPNVIRSSMGLFATMPVLMAEKREVHEFLKEANLEIVGTSSKAQTSIYEKQFQSKIALVMGSESTGLGEFWEKHCHSMITIPMIGRASSLNLNCATTGVLMEINRRKQ
jgi:TrmH family RNA methyltransferase